ncbi:MAG: hypothetical protein ACLQPD_13565 [Desulfomonilaceae bacterium]
MAADHRPLDTDEFISHFEEMPSRVPEEKARGQRGKTGAIRYGVLGILNLKLVVSLAGLMQGDLLGFRRPRFDQPLTQKTFEMAIQGNNSDLCRAT